jgi:hypothetical protein
VAKAQIVWMQIPVFSYDDVATSVTVLLGGVPQLPVDDIVSSKVQCNSKAPTFLLKRVMWVLKYERTTLAVVQIEGGVELSGALHMVRE